MGRRLVTLLALLAGLLLPTPPAAAAAPELATTTIRSGLSNPWDIAFAPDGKMLVTERPGRIRVYRSGSRGAALLHTTTVPNVRAEGESGLMGIAALRRDGIQYVIVCASRQVKAGWRNQVLRYRLGSGGRLTFQKVLLGGMRANTFHNGCAVEIGPDGKVWISMGDAGILSTPQNRTSRNGKILRIKYGGRVPSDNPSGSPVYALGFRNPQGIAFHPRTDRAYSIEHGPDVHDEINRLRPGRNYGWPCWTGPSTRGPGTSGCRAASEYRKPAWSSGGSTLATSGGAFVFGAAWAGWRNDLFVATLKQQDVRRFHISDTGYTASLQSPVLFNERWGRLRASVVTPSGRALYLTTSNGGGTDRVIRVRPS